MARRDDQVVTNWFSPLDALRRLQELGEQLSGAARSITDVEADEDDAAPASGAASPLVAWAERAAELSTMWVSPVRALLEEQQEMIDAISSWAEEQRKLADRFSELAERHRRVTSGFLAALTPTLDNLERLAARSTRPPKRATEATKSAKTTARKRSSSR